MTEIAIIVPTVYRPHLLAPLVENIDAVTATPHRTYVVAERSDRETVRAIEGLECAAVVDHHGFNLPAATNAGVRASHERYVVLTNDDVWFHEGWDTAALAHMTDGVQVVGINQGNGRCDCFFLVDRAYIDGDIFHTGYLSQFCDTELADIARERGVYAEATDALIEHRHWTFGKSGIDDNYRKAVRSFEEDRATYERRKAERQVAA